MSDIPAWFVSDWRNTAMCVDGIYRAHIKQGNRLRSVPRDMWTFIAVTAGALRVNQGGWKADLQPGDQVILRPNSAFTRQVLSDECHWTSIDFRVEATGLGVDPLPALGLPAVVHIPLTPDWLRLYREGLSVMEEDGSDKFVFRGRGTADLIVGSHLKAGISSGAIALTNKAPVPAWLSTTRQQIATSFKQRNLSIHDIAREAGYSRFYFCRAFKKAFHETPMEFLWERRLQVAARKMDDDPFQPLGEVARQCGFASHTHFSRLFRRRFGMTPGQWRRRGSNG